MKLNPVIDRLKAAEIGIDQIRGAADFTQAQQHIKTGGNIFVIPLAETGGRNLASQGVRQEITVRIGIFIGLQDVTGARGKGIEDLDDVIMAGRRALVGWTHPQMVYPWEWSRGQLAGVEQSWLWWREEFTARGYLTADVDEEGAPIPETLYLGIAPRIGPQHEDDYWEVTSGQLPV